MEKYNEQKFARTNIILDRKDLVRICFLQLLSKKTENKSSNQEEKKNYKS